MSSLSLIPGVVTTQGPASKVWDQAAQAKRFLPWQKDFKACILALLPWEMACSVGSQRNEAKRQAPVLPRT